MSSPFAKRRFLCEPRTFSSWFCGLLVVLGLAVPRFALASGEEPLLWLAIVRGATLDRVASEQVREQLASRTELRVVEASLTDEDRRCRTSPCLSALARKHSANIVLSGDIFQLGSKKSQRVVLHLYDGRHRQVFDVENLCGDCDETKLGLLVQTTVTEILSRYQKGQDADAQLNDLFDKSARTGPPEIPAPTSDPVMVPPLPVAPPPTLPLAPTPVPQAPAPQVSIAPTPLQVAPVAAEPVYPSPSLPLSPPRLQPLPPTAVSESIRATDRAPRKGLSTKRKAVAAVLGTLGFATLGGSIAAHYFDRKLDPALAQNPAGTPCSAPSNAGQNCVLTTIGLWAPGYAVSGLLLGGMILTLAIPEK